MKIRIVKLSEKAHIPSRGSEYAAGYDLYSVLEKEIIINPHETVKVRTGIALEIPQGYVGLIFARSGLATKMGLAPANKVGVIDADYRGEIFVALHNHSDQAVILSNEERIAQLMIVPFICADFEETDTLSETQRGEGGFGSTGNK